MVIDMLKKCAAEGLYRMEGSSVWIFADDADIWIIKGESGLSISIWSKDTSMDPLDALHIDWQKIKGEKK
jgi:hypothetical protein